MRLTETARIAQSRALELPAAMLLTCSGAQAADEPLVLARDGFMYIGGKTMQSEGREHVDASVHAGDHGEPSARGRKGRR